MTGRRLVVELVWPEPVDHRAEVGSGGLVRDGTARAGAGLGGRGLIPSPVEGGDGNVEYLLWLLKGEDGVELEVPS